MATFILRYRGFLFGIYMLTLIVKGQNTELDETQVDRNTAKENETECNNLKTNAAKRTHTFDGDMMNCDGEDDVEHELIRKLLDGYDKNVRPIKKKKSIKVDFDLAYNQLVDLDGRQQILTSKVWVRQLWINEFLTWNETQYCGITRIQFDPDLIWKPDIVLYNSIGTSSSGEMYKFGTMIIVHSDGRNEWFAPTEIKSICPIDIAYFPFDYQDCFLKFGAWTQSQSQLNFTLKRPGSADLSMYKLNGEWELHGVPAKRNVIKYTCCEDPFIDITYKIVLKRKVLFYLNNLVMPNLVLAGLVIFSFYVPPESGERVSLNITIMLGLTVFLLLFNERIPPSSDVVPLIGSYYFALFYQVGFSTILTCVTSRCYHHNAFREMPRWFRFLIFRVLAPIFQMDAKAVEQKPKAQRTPQPVEMRNKRPQQLVVYKSASGTFTIKEDSDARSSPNHDCSNHRTLESKIENISRQLETLVDHLKHTEELESKKDEWHFASIVLDKLFFWSFIISIASTTAMFYWKIVNQPRNQ